jgi:hypothetical protein
VNLPNQEIFIRRDFRTQTSADSRISQTPNFVVSQVHDSGSSPVCDLRGFTGTRFPIFTSSRLPSFAGPGLRVFASSRFRSFADSRFQIFAGSGFLKTYFTNFVKLDVSRVTGFPEFPNTSPSGKRVDSDDPISRKSQNFSKKTSPSERRSRHASSVNLATVESRRLLETAPLAPINRELSL